MSETALVETAPAKVNLSLHVLGRRPDLYHLIDSVVVFAGIGDTLRAEPAETLSLTLVGPFASALAGERDNLVLRAARLLAAAAGVAGGARLQLEKRLPVASGIGGGSADAAAALRLLARLWRLAVPSSDLAALALRLGADVPVCLAGRPARMGGTGEILAPIPALPGCGLVLVNPGVAVATASVFAARTGEFSRPFALPAAWPDAAALASSVTTMRNDLEAPAIGLQPIIAEALTALRRVPGCRLARMSGSGATCFGLFDDAPTAVAAAAALAPAAWWRWGGGLAE